MNEQKCLALLCAHKIILFKRAVLFAERIARHFCSFRAILFCRVSSNFMARILFEKLAAISQILNFKRKRLRIKAAKRNIVR